MKKLLCGITLALSSCICIPQALASQPEPTNEQIATFLHATTDLSERVDTIELHFTIKKGDSSDAAWHDTVQKTSDYIVMCLKNDECAVQQYAPFIESLAPLLDQEQGLHGTISIDFGNSQEEADDLTD